MSGPTDRGGPGVPSGAEVGAHVDGVVRPTPTWVGGGGEPWPLATEGIQPQDLAKATAAGAGLGL